MQCLGKTRYEDNSRLMIVRNAYREFQDFLARTESSHSFGVRPLVVFNRSEIWRQMPCRISLEDVAPAEGISLAQE